MVKVRKTRKAPRQKQRYLLQSYWSDAPLSLLERVCLLSWTAFGARVHLYTHDDPVALRAQIPAAAQPHITVLDADVILPRARKFTYKGPAPKSKRADAFTALPFSDLFRYELLRQKGGVWMDMDLVLIRPMPTRVLRAPYFFVTERTIQAGAYASREPTKPTNACIGARDPNSEWARWITDAAAARTETVTSAWTYMRLFQESLRELDLERYLEPPEFVMPVNWWDLDGIFKTEPCLRSKYGVPSTCVADVFGNPATVGIHLFRGLLRKRDLPYEDRSRIPPQSMLGQLLAHVETAAGAML
jgi:hypothetical protein